MRLVARTARGAPGATGGVWLPAGAFEQRSSPPPFCRRPCLYSALVAAWLAWCGGPTRSAWGGGSGRTPAGSGSGGGGGGGSGSGRVWAEEGVRVAELAVSVSRGQSSGCVCRCGVVHHQGEWQWRGAQETEKKKIVGRVLLCLPELFAPARGSLAALRRLRCGVLRPPGNPPSVVAPLHRQRDFPTLPTPSPPSHLAGYRLREGVWWGGRRGFFLPPQKPPQ